VHHTASVSIAIIDHGDLDMAVMAQDCL